MATKSKPSAPRSAAGVQAVIAPSSAPVAAPSLSPFGDGTAAAARAEAMQVTPFEERGAIGTPIVGGFIQDLGEYNPRLEGRAAIPVYEEMRRSDAQVHITLQAVKLPIRAGVPSLEPASDSAIDKQIAEEVQDNLLEGLEYLGTAGQYVSQSWDDVLQNALLMLDFGCAAHEEVYTIDGDRVRMKKLAARLPITFYRFLVEEDGETLIALQQYGYRGNSYLNVDVPASKLGLFVHSKEGANYFGRSILRTAYEHWYVKQCMYKIDAIACERNGLGVPIVKHLPGSGRLSLEDRETAFRFATNLASGHSTGAYMPPGLDMVIQGVAGQVRSCRDSILHHNQQISKVTLAMVVDLGQSSTGNRALGGSMSDLFFMANQAVYDQVCRTISHTAVRRLVDYNYDNVGSTKTKSYRSGPGAKPSGYPLMRAPSVSYVSFETIAETLAKLGLATVDMIHPDDELEAHLRRKMNLPAPAKPRQRFAPTAIRLMGQDPSAAPPPPSAKQAAMSERIAKGRELPMVDGIMVSREPQGAEKFLALSEIVTHLDAGKARVADVLRAAKKSTIAEALHRAIAAPAGRVHQVSVPADPKLVESVAEALKPVKAAGKLTVAQKRSRQLAGAAPRNPKDGVALADAPGADDKLNLYAQSTVSEFTGNLTARAINAALDAKKNPGDATKGEAIVQAQSDIEDATDGWIDRLSGEAANEAFGDGRLAGFGQYSDEIDRFIYSALLDLATCDACSDADGKEGALDEIPDAPNPDCEGGDSCRCVLVAVFGDERRSAA